MNYTATVQTHLLLQAAGKVYFDLDVDDEVPATGELSARQAFCRVWAAFSVSAAHSRADR